MQGLSDFLSFQTMISQPVLIVFYYLGAVVMPLMAWLLALYLGRRFAWLRASAASGKQLFEASVPSRYRWLLLLLFIAAFLFMELMWRLMFEYLIAFMQMRDALVQPGP